MLLLNVQVTGYANTTKITTCLRIAMCQTFTEKKNTTKTKLTQQTSENLDTLYQCFEVFHYLKTSVSKPWHDLVSSRQFCFY